MPGSMHMGSEAPQKVLFWRHSAPLHPKTLSILYIIYGFESSCMFVLIAVNFLAFTTRRVDRADERRRYALWLIQMYRTGGESSTSNGNPTETPLCFSRLLTGSSKIISVPWRTTSLSWLDLFSTEAKAMIEECMVAAVLDTRNRNFDGFASSGLASAI